MAFNGTCRHLERLPYWRLHDRNTMQIGGTVSR